jgi:ABC-type transport system substrate-binding protein
MAYTPIADRPTEKVVLVTNPDYWISIYSSMTYGDRKAFNALGTDDTSVAADVALKRLICDWNLDDSTGNKLEINDTNIDALDEQDISKVMDTLVNVVQHKESKEVKTEKKSSIEKSVQSSVEPVVG